MDRKECYGTISSGHDGPWTHTAIVAHTRPAQECPSATFHDGRGKGSWHSIIFGGPLIGNGGWERSVTFFNGIVHAPTNNLPSMLMKATLIKCSGSHTKKETYKLEGNLLERRGSMGEWGKMEGSKGWKWLKPVIHCRKLSNNKKGKGMDVCMCPHSHKEEWREWRTKKNGEKL